MQPARTRQGRWPSSVAKFNHKRLQQGNEMWIAFTILMVLWVLLKFLLHKGGYVHMLVVAAISIAVVQIIAERKVRYHKTSGD